MQILYTTALECLKDSGGKSWSIILYIKNHIQIDYFEKNHKKNHALWIIAFVFTLAQAIITSRTTFERIFPIKFCLAHMHEYFFLQPKNTAITCYDKMALIYFLLFQASYREAWPLTGRLGLSQGSRASYKEAGPLTRRQSLSHGGRASHMDAEPLTGRPGLSYGGRASPREAWPLTGMPSPHRKAEPLKGRWGLSQGGQASHRKARPLTGRPGLSQSPS